MLNGSYSISFCVWCSDLLGHPLDIHSGGIDLRFPHHDNELAQAEVLLCSLRVLRVCVLLTRR